MVFQLSIAPFPLWAVEIQIKQIQEMISSKTPLTTSKSIKYTHHNISS